VDEGGIMGKYDTAMKCSQVKKLIDDNKYTKALEMLDAMDLDKVHSMADLYLFADVYMKGDRLQEAKDIYYIAYHHTRSNRALGRLIRMVLRTGNIKEARELFLEYEMAAGTTLDTYGLRYYLAKAEGAPRSQLIELLEDLRKEEFTEEWGYQLAKLYELEGDAPHCIEICEEIALWFGVGEIVEKAKALQKRVEQPGWVAPKDEEIPEPLEPNRDEVLPPSYAQPTVFIHEAGEEIIMTKEPPVVLGDSMPSQDEETETEENETFECEEESEEVSEPEEDLHDEEESERETVSQVQEKSDLLDQTQRIEPIEQLMENKQQQKTLEVLTPEKNIFISANGISYYTVKDAMRMVAELKEKTNFVITGGEERIILAVAKKLVKQWNFNETFKAKSIAKIYADKLNKKSMEEKLEKLRGGCLLVLNAEEIGGEGAKTLWDVMNKEKDQMVIILAGNFEKLDQWFTEYPELGDGFGVKIKL
jgi:hypothetical protein